MQNSYNADHRGDSLVSGGNAPVDCDEIENTELYMQPDAGLGLRFHVITAIAVVVNALLIGLEIQLGTIDLPERRRLPWYIVQNVLTLCFLIELVYRVHRMRGTFFSEKWNLIDLVLVSASIISTWILPFTTPSIAADAYVGSSTVRLIRILTAGRLLGTLMAFRELWVVIAGFFEAVKTLFWISIFLVFILYICAVFTTIQIGQNPDLYHPYIQISGGWDYREYFGSVGKSMLTLFQIVTLDDWGNGVARHVMSNEPIMAIFFVFFVAATSFGLMNVVVGIIVERTLATAKQNQQKFQRTQERERARVLNYLREIFEYADKDGNGSLSVEEFRNAIRQPEVERKLKLIDLPVADAEELFAILDHDGSGELSVDEFIGGCVRLKGVSKSKDLLAVQVSMEALAERLETLQLQLEQLETSLEETDSQTQELVSEFGKKLNNNATREKSTTAHDV